MPHRATRDADFLGFGEVDPSVLREIVRKVSGIDSDDGMAFDPNSVTVEEMREEARYGGLRVRVTGHLGAARRHCPKAYPWDSWWSFPTMPTNRPQWRAFLGKNRLVGPTLDEVVTGISSFVRGQLHRARRGDSSG